MDVIVSGQDGNELIMHLAKITGNDYSVALHGMLESGEDHAVEYYIPMQVITQYIRDVMSDDYRQPTGIASPIICTDKALGDVFAEYYGVPSKPKLKVAGGTDFKVC